MMHAATEQRLLFGKRTLRQRSASCRLPPAPISLIICAPGAAPCSGVLTIHLEKAEGLGRAAHATGFTKK